MSVEAFGQACLAGGLPVMQREFEELISELDPGKTGQVSYDSFMSQVFLCQMFLKELNLTTVLQ